MSDKLDVAGDPELRRALLVARSRPDGMTADDAAEALGVHRNVARARLDRLASAGFLRVLFARRTGRTGPGAGRPAKIYEVAPDTEIVEFPERHLDELSQLLAARLDEPDLRAVGIDYGRRLAKRSRIRPGRDAPRAMRKLCERLGQNGFNVKVVEATANNVTLACPTCPLRPVVQGSAAGVTVDRAMWTALAESAIQGVRADRVSCTTEGCSDDHSTCRVVISFES